jgi:hypothetical protein
MAKDKAKKRAVKTVEKAVRKAVKRGVTQAALVRAVEVASSDAVKRKSVGKVTAPKADESKTA